MITKQSNAAKVNIGLTKQAKYKVSESKLSLQNGLFRQTVKFIDYFYF